MNTKSTVFLIAIFVFILFFSISFQTKEARADITTGLVSHYKLDETSGTTATDSTGTNTGTLTNSPTWTVGKINNALSFDGVNDYVYLNSPASLQPTSISVSTWFKTGATSGRIIRKRLSGYYLEITAGKASFVVAIPSFASVTSTLTYNDNLWHHAVGLYDGTTLRLYIDGSQVASASASGNITYGAGGIAIGRDGDYSGSYFNGVIDDVRIYNRALSADEIRLLYNLGR